MQVKEIMTSGVETISSDSTLNQAARKMKSLDVGALPIQEDDSIVGMITGRDIIVRALAEDRDPHSTLVSDIMTGEVFCCSGQENIEEAVRIMEDKHVHRLLVLSSDNRPVGILSLSDIAVKTHNEHLTWELLERICEPSYPNR